MKTKLHPGSYHAEIANKVFEATGAMKLLPGNRCHFAAIGALLPGSGYGSKSEEGLLLTTMRLFLVFSSNWHSNLNLVGVFNIYPQDAGRHPDARCQFNNIVTSVICHLNFKPYSLEFVS